MTDPQSWFCVAAWLVLVLLLSSPIHSVSSMQCRGQKNQPVDWFIVYKVPKLRHLAGTDLGEGVAQFYMDADDARWTRSPRPINETGHAIYYTLEQVYSASENSVLFLMFNDEKPSGSTSLSHGHTKGTVGFDQSSGFWLIHSAPRFPPSKKDGYTWAENASDYGQSFLCVSFAYKALDILARQWLFYYPQVYDHYLPAPAVADFPQLLDLVNSTRVSSPPYFSVRQDLTTLAGMPLVNFAKFTYFGRDLYDALVAPTLKVPLLVETWQNGPKDIFLPDNCSIPYQVYNVQDVTLPPNLTFKEHKDHSKFALSYTPDSWVCVGGINRQSTQFKRAGGTMCFQHKEAWQSYHGIITFFESCKDTALRFVPS